MNARLNRLAFRARRSPQLIIGAVLVGLFVLVSVLGPALSPYSPTAQKMAQRLRPPTTEFVLGTDDFGRDVLSRVMYGAMPSLQVGVLSVVVSLLIGTVVGLTAGWRGGWTDQILMSLMDVLFAFPAVLLAIAILAVLGPSLNNVVLAIAIVNLPTFARLTRASTLATKELLFVEAARSLGVSASSIARRHILPNIAAPLIVQVSLTIAAAVLVEASLSYLGLGIQPPAPSWGNILSSTYGFIQTNAWPSVVAGLAIALCVLGFNLLGDGLRDVLDPRLKA